MALTTKPSETNKFVAKPSKIETPKPQGYRRFNAMPNNTRVTAPSEEELLKILQLKTSNGWYQVSDIHLEIGESTGKEEYEIIRKEIDSVHKRSKKIIKPDIYFVYITKIKPAILREYKKAY